MKRVAILIPAHCPPKVLKLTLGSWLETYDQSYDVRVYIGMHKNYSDCHHGQSEIEALAGNKVKICFVDELNWMIGLNQKNEWRHLMRYSEMHSISLTNLMNEASVFDPDYVAIFDHDLVFKQDFIRWGFETYPDSDMTGCLLSDRETDIETHTGFGVFRFMPKFSIWHVLITRRLHRMIVEQKGVIFPFLTGNLTYDTFARVYEFAKGGWNMNVTTLKEADLSPVVRHIWSMSLNFGYAQTDGKTYGNKVAAVEAEYDATFPNGIMHLMEKL